MAQAPVPPFREMLELLRGVSRSFYVSIRLLPHALRRPVALAYLLARATDTVADTGEFPAWERRETLEALAAAIDGRTIMAGTAAIVPESFVGVQHHPGERNLIASVPRCLSWMEELSTADRDDIRAVLRRIIQGQALDIERFDHAAKPAAPLQSGEQLDEYTYLVAGCVGEFWTGLCFRHLPEFATLPEQQMRELGRGYGMGLQLVNILRDVGADLGAGRCYFPAGELAAAGIAPGNILADPGRFEPVWNRWCARAQGRLELGISYAQAVRHRRVRAASALPALLGMRTLTLLRSAGPQRLGQNVKVPRLEVRSIMARLLFTLASRAPLQALAGRLQHRRPGDNRLP